MIEAWLLKKASFQKITEHGLMQKASILGKDDNRGCMALTMSGSLIMIGPLVEGAREIKYTSMGMRTDVPESFVLPDGRLAGDIECEKPIYLADSKLEKTSPVMDIAVMGGEKTAPDQTVFLRKADDRLKSDFIRFNKEALEENETRDVLARRDDLFQKWIVIQWFIYGGLDRHVFMARAKLLWLELFTRVYDVLSGKKAGANERDSMFLDFTNKLFAKFCDDYKWYESEHKDFDIGLMKALEELPEYKSYLDFVDGFCNGVSTA